MVWIPLPAPSTEPFTAPAISPVIHLTRAPYTKGIQTHVTLPETLTYPCTRCVSLRGLCRRCPVAHSGFEVLRHKHVIRQHARHLRIQPVLPLIPLTLVGGQLLHLPRPPLHHLSRQQRGRDVRLWEESDTGAGLWVRCDVVRCGTSAWATRPEGHES